MGYDIHVPISNSVNPGIHKPLITVEHWAGTIFQYQIVHHHYVEGTPIVNKPWFINPGLTLDDYGLQIRPTNIGFN